MPPFIQIFPDLERLSQAAAAYFQEAVLEASALRGRALVAISGGGTPLGMFRALASPPLAGAVPWRTVHFFWCDERCVPPDDAQSNFGQARQTLIDHVDVPDANLHRIPGELGAETAAMTYRETLRRFRSAGLDWPVFDFVLLGLGADGHTASLFPGLPIPDGAAALPVSAEAAGRPPERVTLTPAVFNSARNILFLAAGAVKSGAVRDALSGAVDENRFPAQRIRPANGAVRWFLDEAAARELKSA